MSISYLVSFHLGEIFSTDHKLEIQTNSNERHEVETDGTEKEPNSLVDESHNVEGPMSIFSWFLVSELGYFKFHVFAGSNFVIDE